MESPEFQFDVFSANDHHFSLRDSVSFVDANAASAAAASRRHSRSMSAPVYQRPSGGWGEAFQYKEVFMPDKTRGWSYMLKRSDVDTRISQRASLEKDVHELQLQLEIEKTVRKVLEKALTSPCCEPLSSGVLSPQITELIKEISSLESEVVHLEKHVLSLYRKVFDGRGTPQDASVPMRLLSSSDHQHNVSVRHRPRKAYSFQHRRHASQGCQSLQDAVSYAHSKTRHASLLGGKFRIAEEQENETRVYSSEFDVPSPRGWALACDPHTPLQDAAPDRNLTEFYDSPNKLSERMVRCMAAIYCKLADPPLPSTGDALSPPSSSSMSSTGTSRDVSSEGWSPLSKESVTCSTSMIEVPWIRVDKERLTYAAQALRNFRSMVEQLESVHPGEMKHDEKLAFWINIHNALVMHAYLAYGIPRSNLKRASLLQKAAYKVGSYSINACTIENSILGCRSQRPAQWLQTLFGPLTKFKSEERRAYALNTPEPLICFALCSGGRSDPAVRAYTPKSVKTELESAKRDFLLANISTKNSKVLAPKLVEAYARDAGLSSSKLLDWIIRNASDKQARNFRHGKSTGQRQRHLEWIPYDFNFGYVFVRELATTTR
ncbi:uncharacterized protein LOC9649075 [Selaginella moellendorffii]|uniref:uncharacterized protein LOC9649075 n=1 Tax=Selaginella moellendorffii TaxID=88036 RepID=UPI000D1C58B7|nr:uncharacterized protein LOC9649075 [Selaginella moellendorffii]|eukprot:XP_002984988.2 uncharacterized protein LOC9649075 [Selaginella moellendorffii]